MPNHCRNRLTVSGERAELDKFKERAAGVQWKMCFNNFIARPPHDEVADANFIIDWSQDNWGTKWDAYEVVLTDSLEGLEYLFSTAWSPVNEVLLTAIAGAFPTLQFGLAFAERGGCFYGASQAVNGEVNGYVVADGMKEDDEGRVWKDGNLLPAIFQKLARDSF